MNKKEKGELIIAIKSEAGQREHRTDKDYVTLLNEITQAQTVHFSTFEDLCESYLSQCGEFKRKKQNFWHTFSPDMILPSGMVIAKNGLKRPIQFLIQFYKSTDVG